MMSNTRSLSLSLFLVNQVAMAASLFSDLCYRYNGVSAANILLQQPSTCQPVTPWTHSPICATYRGADADATAEFCVYTLADHGSHGISVITGPEDAARLAYVVTTSHAKPSDANDAAFQVVYEVVQIPGKGKGVVAQEYIPAHEVIISDYPAILTHKQWGKFTAIETERDLECLAVEQLSNPEAVFSLSSGNKLKDSGRGKRRVRGILGVNSFELDIGEARYAAMYPIISVCIALLYDLICWIK